MFIGVAARGEGGGRKCDSVTSEFFISREEEIENWGIETGARHLAGEFSLLFMFINILALSVVP